METGVTVRPGVFTFEAFAEAMLATADRPIRLISAVRRKALIRDCLGSIKRSPEGTPLAGRAKVFATLADSPGLVDA
ncbi:unnamed protein product, partial [marine sediment metagenome]